MQISFNLKKKHNFLWLYTLFTMPFSFLLLVCPCFLDFLTSPLLFSPCILRLHLDTVLSSTWNHSAKSQLCVARSSRHFSFLFSDFSFLCCIAHFQPLSENVSSLPSYNSYLLCVYPLVSFVGSLNFAYPLNTSVLHGSLGLLLFSLSDRLSWVIWYSSWF